MITEAYRRCANRKKKNASKIHSNIKSRKSVNCTHATHTYAHTQTKARARAFMVLTTAARWRRRYFVFVVGTSEELGRLACVNVEGK